MIFGYINKLFAIELENQKQELFKVFQCDRFYIEPDQNNRSRTELDQLLNDIRPGDILCLYSIKSLPVSTIELIELIDKLYSVKKVELKTLLEGNVHWNDFIILADFNSNFRRDRAMVGLTSARARGRSGGRKVGLSEDAKKKANAAAKLYEAQTPINDILKTLGIKSKATLYRYLRYEGVKEVKQNPGSDINLILNQDNIKM